MSALKLTQIGNSVGVILPKEVLARLKVEKGDTLFMTEANTAAEPGCATKRLLQSALASQAEATLVIRGG